MEFTQVEDLDSPSELQVPLQPSSNATTPISSYQVDTEQKYNEMLSSFEKINNSFVIMPDHLEIQQVKEQLEDGHEFHRQIVDSSKQNETHTSSNPHQMLKSSKKSLIFTPTKNIIACNNKTKNNEIDIYYFGQPIYKRILIEAHDDILTLIRKAITAYKNQKSFDQLLIAKNDPHGYELRFSETQGSCKPDMKVGPIESHRKIADSIFDVLILIPATQKQIKIRQSLRKTVQSPTQLTDQVTKMTLKNLEGEEVISIIVKLTDTMVKVYQYAQQKYQEEIYLAEQPDSECFIPKDFEVRNLSNYNIYIKKKEYLDQPSNSTRKFRVISSIPTNLSKQVLPPIGIDQASRYQEFSVIKINRRGTQQARILGIDQTKIYNYDEAIRKQKTQASSFFGLFNKQNPMTGTKQPERLVSSILNLKSLEGLNFTICFQQKNIEYIAKDENQKDRILRKLKFLVRFHHDRLSTENIMKRR